MVLPSLPAPHAEVSWRPIADEMHANCLQLQPHQRPKCKSDIAEKSCSKSVQPRLCKHIAENADFGSALIHLSGENASQGAATVSYIIASQDYVPPRDIDKEIELQLQVPDQGLVVSQSGTVGMRPLPELWDLHIEVLAVTNITDAAYRIGDTLQQYLDPDHHIYAIFTLGKAKWSTEVHQGKDGNVEFDEERNHNMLFGNTGVTRLQFQVLSRRGVQRLIRGDPIVGERALRLDGRLLDGHAVIPVDLQRGGESRGSMMLRLRAFARSTETALMPSLVPRGSSHNGIIEL